MPGFVPWGACGGSNTANDIIFGLFFHGTEISSADGDSCVFFVWQRNAEFISATRIV